MGAYCQRGREQPNPEQASCSSTNRAQASMRYFCRVNVHFLVCAFLLGSCCITTSVTLLFGNLWSFSRRFVCSFLSSPLLLAS